jgi:hypothetical protein
MAAIMLSSARSPLTNISYFGFIQESNTSRCKGLDLQCMVQSSPASPPKVSPTIHSTSEKSHCSPTAEKVPEFSFKLPLPDPEPSLLCDEMPDIDTWMPNIAKLPQRRSTTPVRRSCSTAADLRAITESLAVLPSKVAAALPVTVKSPSAPAASSPAPAPYFMSLNNPGCPVLWQRKSNGTIATANGLQRPRQCTPFTCQPTILLSCAPGVANSIVLSHVLGLAWHDTCCLPAFMLGPAV